MDKQGLRQIQREIGLIESVLQGGKAERNDPDLLVGLERLEGE